MLHPHFHSQKDKGCYPFQKFTLLYLPNFIAHLHKLHWHILRELSCLSFSDIVEGELLSDSVVE